MKFLKTKKYSILSNLFKYSFVGVFAFTLFMSTFFVSKYNNVEGAASPEIISISPISGAIDGTVTISGNNFIGVDKIFFGTVDIGTNFKAISKTQITAQVPSDFINGKIIVRTTNGEAISADKFYAYTVSPYNLGKISAENITTSSVDIFFSPEGKTPNRTYAIDLKKKNNPTTDTNKVKIFKNTDLGDFGYSMINFTGLISNTDYIATITSQAETSEINFKTLPKPGDKIAPTIYTTNVTSNSVSVNFSITNKSDATPPYTVTVTESNQNGEIDPSNNQFKTIEIGQISDMGLAVLNFTGLKPVTDFKVKLVNDNIVLSEISFSTPVATSLAKITSISPTSGKVGDTVTISGEHLAGEDQVYFNGVPAVVDTNNQTEIVVSIPVGATSGNITIKIIGTLNPDGSNNDTMISGPTPFTVLDASGTVVPPGDTTPPSGSTVTPKRVYKFNGLVPICNTKIDSVKGGFSDPCDFDVVMALINTLIGYLLVTMATPLFALIIIYVGWLYLSDMGSSENITKAKKILKNAVIGYVIALAAWLIVKTILASLGFNGPMFLG
ncbi:MAG TPA: IPT/TIG domain-containing protein [Candidatus Paceibacterota bacterium]